MGKAARAIIVRGNELLLMKRNKGGSEYFTLVGGRVNDGEDLEQALAREVKEETGLTVTKAQLMFIEEHPAPYNEQYSYLCEVAPFEKMGLTENSEEEVMNRLDMNVHTPMWVRISTLPIIHFRTPALVNALIEAFKDGFPKEPKKL